MRTQFDLRSADLVRQESKNTSFNAVRLLVVLLLLLFVGSSGFYVVVTTLKVFSLMESVEYKQSEVDRLEAGRVALTAEITRLQEREKVFTDTLKIMQDDLPSLEVFEAMENCIESGMRVVDLKFNPPTTASGGAPSVVLNAMADTDEQTTRFRIGLENSGVFSRVTMPTSKLDEKTRKVLFTLNLSLLPIGQINVSAAR
jgi:cell division protein FtsB